MNSGWPFAAPPATEVISLRRIFSDGAPIRLVTHDADDGCWQFLDGDQVWEDDAVLLTLVEMMSHDETLTELADLPAGWIAIRADPGHPWQRQPAEPSADA
jgi:hypothetical protein